MSQQIHNIVKDISDMSNTEILEKIQTLRRTRNTPAKVSSKAKDRPSKKTKSKDTLVSLMASMSDEERSKLLAKLQEG